MRSKATDPTTEYALAVRDGKIVAGRLVRLACLRHLKDQEEGKSRGLKWDVAAANRAIEFFGYLRLADGQFAGQPFKLQPFQQFIVGCVFGWLGPDGFRRFRTAYCEEAKGNGKTPQAAAIGLYGLVADDEAGAEIYPAATTREQAGILFRDAKRLVESSPQLRKRLEVQQYNISHPASGSFLRPVSSEHRGLDGKRPHMALIDEIHEHPTSLVVDKLRAGTKARRQALIFETTNAGYDRTTVCWTHHEYSVKVLEDVVEDDSWFAYVAALDCCDKCRAEGKTQPTDNCKQCDQWDDEAVWTKANPGLDTILPRKYLREQVHEAKGMPSKESIVKRLNFCLWCVAPWTLVTMADGSRRMAKDLRPGDLILAFDHNKDRLVLARVKHALDNGMAPLYRVTTARGRVTEVTGNHRFWHRFGRTDSPKYGWIKAEDLRLGDRLGIALGGPLCVFNGMNVGEAYLLGVMVGDGSCKTSCPRITNREPAIVAACNQVLRPNGCEFATQSNLKYHHARSLIRRPGSKSLNWLRRVLRQHGLEGKTCFDKRVPKAVFSGGPDVWAAFLSGYLDTDGYVLKGIIAWCSCNRELLADCQHLLATLGIQSSLNSVPSETATDGLQWRLEIRDKRSLRNAVGVLVPAHPRKAAKLKKLDLVNQRVGNGACPIDVSRFDRVTEIEQLPATPTIAIEVEGVHTHITDGFITHNTEAAVHAIPMDAWDSNKREIDLESLKGQECYAGLDIGATSDFTCLAILFPHDDAEEIEVPADWSKPEGDKKAATRRTFTLLPFFWLPERSKQRDPHLRAVIDGWRRGGLIRTTAGDVVDYDQVVEEIVALRDDYPFAELAFDRGFQGSQTGTNLIRHFGEEAVISFPQGILSMNAPFRELVELVILGRLHHDGNPVLRWMASNCAAETRGGLIKPSKEKSSEKIDIITAATMALGRAMLRAGNVQWSIEV